MAQHVSYARSSASERYYQKKTLSRLLRGTWVLGEEGWKGEDRWGGSLKNHGEVLKSPDEATFLHLNR